MAPDDYTSYNDVPLVFAQGERTVCHRVNITDDSECEVGSTEAFSSTLRLVNGVPPIAIDPLQAVVVINDTNEPECGAYVRILTTYMRKI